MLAKRGHIFSSPLMVLPRTIPSMGIMYLQTGNDFVNDHTCCQQFCVCCSASAPACNLHMTNAQRSLTLSSWGLFIALGMAIWCNILLCTHCACHQGCTCSTTSIAYAMHMPADPDTIRYVFQNMPCQPCKDEWLSKAAHGSERCCHSDLQHLAHVGWQMQLEQELHAQTHCSNLSTEQHVYL